MYAIEFQTKIKNGIIEIPLKDWQRLQQQTSQEPVRVIVLTREQVGIEVDTDGVDLIGQWLTNPVDIPNFTPLTREEAHERL